MSVNVNSCLKRWTDRLQTASADRTHLRLRGSGSKDFYGQSLTGELFDTREYTGIVAYEPTELVVTARCGTPLAELEEALAGKGQSLPFEPPHFGTGATVGGCVASGLSGPRRAQAGALRDFVLGVKILNGQGELLSFGGQVMKNVAGYDVSRLMAGSLGTVSYTHLDVYKRQGLKLNCQSTARAMKVAPKSSMIALMIWTQVVAVMPPNNT